MGAQRYQMDTPPRRSISASPKEDFPVLSRDVQTEGKTVSFGSGKEAYVAAVWGRGVLQRGPGYS